MMVMFYVKGGSMAKDGQAVAEMLKAKIENEEGFFEFRMLKVEPYSKYIHNSHHNSLSSNSTIQEPVVQSLKCIILSTG